MSICKEERKTCIVEKQVDDYCFMLDLTPGVIVGAPYQRIYTRLRFLLWALLMVVSVVILMRFIFPTEQRFFNFRSYYGSGNSLAAPRLATSGDPIEKGRVSARTEMLWNAFAVGSFSEAQVRMVLENNSDLVKNGRVSLVRAYRAWLYPEGDVVGFEDGYVALSEGKYYLLSGGTWRAFASEAVLKGFGLQPRGIPELSGKEMTAHSLGDPITDALQLVEGMLIKTGGNHYQFQNGSLVSFVSERAFLSRFSESVAAEKEEEILQRYPVSEKMIGFIDGTLLSHDQSVYVVSGEALRPVASADVFLAKGYQWEDVVPATGEEFGIYTRGKLYTFGEPHPGGTVFFNTDKTQYFLVQGGKKRPIYSEAVRNQFSGVAPIEVTSASDPLSCELQKRVAFSKIFECRIPLGDTRSSTMEYQFAYSGETGVVFQEMHVDFIRNINQKGFEYFLNGTKQKWDFRYQSR